MLMPKAPSFKFALFIIYLSLHTQSAVSPTSRPPLLCSAVSKPSGKETCSSTASLSLRKSRTVTYFTGHISSTHILEEHGWNSKYAVGWIWMGSHRRLVRSFHLQVSHLEGGGHGTLQTWKCPKHIQYLDLPIKSTELESTANWYVVSLMLCSPLPDYSGTAWTGFWKEDYGAQCTREQQDFLGGGWGNHFLEKVLRIQDATPHGKECVSKMRDAHTTLCIAKEIICYPRHTAIPLNPTCITH